jgi:predicted RNase H-like HicB family nuclease
MTKGKKKIPSEVLTLEGSYEVVIEQDEDGLYIASIPELKGCHTQAKTLDELRDRLCKATILYLDDMLDRLKVWIDYKNE